MPIETVAQLHSQLRLALQIELATIPPYLYSMYSIADQESEAALLIRSIVAEEMLHAALVANVILAVGGDPRFGEAELVFEYPMWLPHHAPPLQLGLRPASPELISDVFMKLEQPEAHETPAVPDEYESLGQFYHAVENALRQLEDTTELFAEPQAARQLSNPAHYSPVKFDAEDSGGLLLVHDLETAFEAIEIIVHQGEGLGSHRWADPSHQELTHYHKLVQIAEGKSPLGEILPVPDDPRTSDYPASLQPVSMLFNLAFRKTYLTLESLYEPVIDKGPLVGKLYLLMSSVMSDLAHYLVRQPAGGGVNAAPTFEPLDIDRMTVDTEVERVGPVVAADHPELAGTVDLFHSLLSD